MLTYTLKGSILDIITSTMSGQHDTNGNKGYHYPNSQDVIIPNSEFMSTYNCDWLTEKGSYS